ncbi:MAG: MerR family transcriptional regulator [Bacteroidetes bacterium]|nr:MerR family transcriptional regulator [Bacteroidota bacterium]
MKEAKYSIKDLEKLSGIKAHTLRIWEKRYEILTPLRTNTNIRYYTDTDLKKILNVALLNRQGYKISYLSKLTDEALNEQVISLTHNDVISDLQTDGLLSAMIEYDENKFEKVINKAIIHYGFEDTLVKVIYPLFQRISLLWQTGAINPSHEHFISNLIRQKIVVAIDGLFNNLSPRAKTFFLFLRDGEWHELGLLIYYYFIKKAGHKVIYFGQSLPFSSLLDSCNSYSPDFLVTSITCSLQEQETKEYLNQLSTLLPDKTTYISGLQLKDKVDSLPINIKLITSLPDFKLELNSLTIL